MGAVSADIESPYTFGVRCSNEKIRFGLTSSVQEIWALENKVKIGPDTLKGTYMQGPDLALTGKELKCPKTIQNEIKTGSRVME